MARMIPSRMHSTTSEGKSASALAVCEEPGRACMVRQGAAKAGQREVLTGRDTGNTRRRKADVKGTDTGEKGSRKYCTLNLIVPS